MFSMELSAFLVLSNKSRSFYFTNLMRIIFLVTIIGLISCNSGNKKEAGTTTPNNINGEVLFKSNCATCHKCVEDFVAPALHGSLERWGGDKALMYKFIKNPWGVMQENEYAKALQKKYSGNLMPPSELSENELDAIFNFCDQPVPAK